MGIEVIREATCDRCAKVERAPNEPPDARPDHWGEVEARHYPGKDCPGEPFIERGTWLLCHACEKTVLDVLLERTGHLTLLERTGHLTRGET